MSEVKVKHTLIKIVGLLGDFPLKKRLDFQQKLIKSGYKEDSGYENSENMLKDIFYPDFRNLMFVKNDEKGEDELLSRRFILQKNENISFIKRNKQGNIAGRYSAVINKTEIFLFSNQIGLFALTLSISESNKNLNFISDLLNQCRKFDAEIDIHSSDTNAGPKWHEWISEKLLCGKRLRHEKEKIKADEFSGSKFKVFTVVDCGILPVDRRNLLFDLGTSSPLNSAKGDGFYAPHPDYFNDLMKNKISIFNNWESLCLFDSFTTVGNDVLYDEDTVKTWEDSYFRIYLFRLFFKYNLYRYNSDLHDNTVKLRNEFEKFLNNYNLSHISFNFLPNEIFNKIGDALHINEELENFQKRINRISSAILEDKQSRTNALLKIVSVLGGLSSAQPVYDGMLLFKGKFHLTDIQFNILLSTVLFIIGLMILIFLMPEAWRKLKKRLFKYKKNKKIQF